MKTWIAVLNKCIFPARPVLMEMIRFCSILKPSGWSWPSLPHPDGLTHADLLEISATQMSSGLFSRLHIEDSSHSQSQLDNLNWLNLKGF